MIKELKQIIKREKQSVYSLAIDIGVSYFVLYKALHKQKISDKMKKKIEGFIENYGM